MADSSGNSRFDPRPEQPSGETLKSSGPMLRWFSVLFLILIVLGIYVLALRRSEHQVLAQQVRIACVQARDCVARLTGKELPTFKFALEKSKAKVVGKSMAREATVEQLPVMAGQGKIDNILALAGIQLAAVGGGEQVVHLVFVRRLVRAAGTVQ